MGFASTFRARVARRAASWLLPAAVAALVAGLGLGWLTLDAGPPGGVSLAGGAAAPKGAGSTGGPGEPGGSLADGLGPQPHRDTASPSPEPTASPSPDAATPSPGTAAVAGAGQGDRVTVVVDGSSQQVPAQHGTVAELLARLGVDVGRHGRVHPAPTRSLDGVERVVVERAEVRRRHREVAIAHGQREQATGALPAGQRRTVRQGRAGLVRITEEIVEVGGDVVATRELDRRTTRPPREAIVEVGVAAPAGGDPGDGQTPSPEAPAEGAPDTDTGPGTEGEPGDPAPAEPAEPGDDPEPAEPAEPGDDPAPAEPPEGSPEAGGADPADPATWDRLAQCESSGNWQANTGNGFYGGLQFTLDSWRSVGGTGRPDQHPRETQIEMGRRLQARRGWAPWPRCARELGYR